MKHNYISNFFFLDYLEYNYSPKKPNAYPKYKISNYGNINYLFIIFKFSNHHILHIYNKNKIWIKSKRNFLIIFLLIMNKKKNHI